MTTALDCYDVDRVLDRHPYRCSGLYFVSSTKGLLVITVEFRPEVVDCDPNPIQKLEYESLKCTNISHTCALKSKTNENVFNTLCTHFM